MSEARECDICDRLYKHDSICAPLHVDLSDLGEGWGDLQMSLCIEDIGDTDDVTFADVCPRCTEKACAFAASQIA